MADIVRAQREQIPATMKTRYRDMGDGTHAQVVAAESGAAIGPGSPVVDSFGSAVIDLAATSNNQRDSRNRPSNRSGKGARGASCSAIRLPWFAQIQPHRQR